MSVVCGLVELIATAGLATDAPDEGSGPARRGRARLQHMSGSRVQVARHLGTVVVECRRPARAGRSRGIGGRGRSGWSDGWSGWIWGSRARTRCGCSTRTGGRCAGAGASRRWTSLAAVEAAALAGAPAGTRVGGGDGADRAGVVADRGVLLRPRAPGVPGVQREGRRPAPVLVPAREEQRDRRGHVGPVAVGGPGGVAPVGAARRGGGGVGPAGPGHGPADRAGRRAQGADQGPDPAAAAVFPADR